MAIHINVITNNMINNNNSIFLLVFICLLTRIF
nr:MAG TPA: hypothetical protein [Caudoviricetes sp.]